MARHAKVAVSLPEGTLAALDRIRNQRQQSRSAAVTEAIEGWLRAPLVTEEERRYAARYLRHPEKLEETPAIARAVIEGWEPWDLKSTLRKRR